MERIIKPSKRMFWLTLALCMIIVLAACGTQQGESAPGNQETAAPSQPETDSIPEESSRAEMLPSSETSSTETSSTDAGESDAPEGTGSKVLVAYFSCTGNTEGVAWKIADTLGADAYEILPEQPYTEADLNYGDSSSRGTMEQNDESCRPAISGSVENMEQYDIVFIGYPIWWGQAPRVISTFLESYDFSGKTIVPFCTSGSSPIGSSATNLHGLASGAGWRTGQRFSGGASQEELAQWIEGLELDMIEE